MGVPGVVKGALITANGFLLMPKVGSGAEEESAAALEASAIGSIEDLYTKLLKIGFPKCVITTDVVPINSKTKPVNMVMYKVGVRNILVLFMETYPDQAMIEKVKEAAEKIDKLLG